MEEQIEYRYIIDNYNKYQSNHNVVKTFNLRIGGFYEPYCIRKIPTTYFWGELQLEDWPEQDWEQDYSSQHSYSTLEEAMDFVRYQKRCNG